MATLNTLVSVSYRDSSIEIAFLVSRTKIRISFLYYTHALPCKTAQNESFYVDNDNGPNCNYSFTRGRENHTDDGKPKRMHAVKNHHTPFETKTESMKKIQRNESKEFNKRPNEVPKSSLLNNRLQCVRQACYRAIDFYEGARLVAFNANFNLSTFPDQNSSTFLSFLSRDVSSPLP